MGRSDLIGNGKHHLIPTWQPLADDGYQSARKKNSSPPGAKVTSRVAQRLAKVVQPVKGRLLTQHTGLPPRDAGSNVSASKPLPSLHKKLLNHPKGPLQT